MHHHLSVCQTLQLHTRQNPYLLENPATVSPPLHFLEEFTPWLGTAAALGGTVAVVSPALSRPSPPANESSSAGRGGWSPGERTSAAPPPPTLLSLSGQNGKLLPATPPTTSKSTQKTTPDHNFATTLAIITVLVAIMTATVEKVS